ncbi:MAG TPA: DUF5916 domain-containing protein, partial [Gemmatimonadaceae bacterium]|nr:DUF5916 domain-containing protein [Gemmatimonadaceae bacterium]
NWNAFVFQNDAFNWGGRPVFHGYSARTNATLKSFWSVNLGASWSPKYYDDVLLRGGPEAAQPSSIYSDMSLGTDSRRRVVGNLSAAYAHDVLGGYSKEASIKIDFRPTSNVHVNVGPAFEQLYDTERWVRTIADTTANATFDRRYVLAALRQNTLSLETRMDVTVSPTLSFVMYVQPFVSAGRYNGFKEFQTPGQFDFAVYGANNFARDTISYDRKTQLYTIDPDKSGPAKPFTLGQPNFNFRSLRGNAVVRWDYRPGSSLYLVWQQERSDAVRYGEFQARRDVGSIFRTIPTNVFLIKATYWLAR